jgi:hypothetical protein
MAEQKRTLMAMLALAIANLDKPEALDSVARDLGQRHLGYGTQELPFEAVGSALLWTLERARSGLHIGCPPGLDQDVRRPGRPDEVVLRPGSLTKSARRTTLRACGARPSQRGRPLTATASLHERPRLPFRRRDRRRSIS